jgi:hypothetical protein
MSLGARIPYKIQMTGGLENEVNSSTSNLANPQNLRECLGDRSEARTSSFREVILLQ